MIARRQSGEQHKERRRAERGVKPGKVSLSWSLEGRERVSQVELVDLSSTGMRLKLKDALPVGLAIRFRVDGIALHGSAVVRHCTQKRLMYLVGVEFLGGLVWKQQ